MDNVKFGKFIKQLRQENKMTQKELAEKLHLTDKAVSKWERGLSFPDITILDELAKTFNVTVEEIVNAEFENKKDIEIQEKTNIKINKRKTKIENIKNIAEKVSIILCPFFLIMQFTYLTVLKIFEYEYVIDYLFYVVNQIIIISGSITIIFQLNKNKANMKYKIYIISAGILLTLINGLFMINNGFDNKCIVEFSSDFSNQLVLKQNKKNGSTVLYKNAKIWFARPKEQFSYSVVGEIKRQWLTTDICSLTYMDSTGKLREFIVTNGDRGNGIGYYTVESAIRGNWQTYSQYGDTTRIIVDNKGITIEKNGENQLFENSSYKQFGTLALVLYDEETPKYIIALDKNCILNNVTDRIEDGGTIILCEVSMGQTIAETLYCTM